MSYYKQNKLFREKELGCLPLTVGQYDIWIEQQLYPDDFSNHSNFVAKIGDVDEGAMERALQRLAERHEVIRTYFPVEGGVPVRKMGSVALQFVDCKGEEVEPKILEDYRKPFDLTSEVPYRFILYKGDSCYLQIIEHHIAVTMDAYVNLPVELAKLYVSERDGKEPQLPGLVSSYSAYVEDQYANFSSDRFKADASYWENYLAGPLPLPVFPASSGGHQFVVKNYRCPIEGDLLCKVKEMGLALNASVFTLFAASFHAFLHLYTNQEEIITGIPNDTRRGVHKEVIGYTANSLPIRSRFNPEEEFALFLKKYSSDVRGMIKHRLYPLRMILDGLMEKNGNQFSELFKVLIISQKSEEHSDLAAFGVGEKGVVCSVDGFQYVSIGMGVMSSGRFDFAVAFAETSRGHVISFHYNGVLIEESAVQEIASLYLHVLRQITDNPHAQMKDLTLYPELPLVNLCNQTGVNFEEKGSFVDWFERQVKVAPQATAVVYEGKEVSYQTLNGMANQVARHLHKLGASAETLVGVAVNRSIELIVSLLGVMKAGSAYLPLDPDLPKERLQFMLEDSSTKILITENAYWGLFEGFQGETVLVDKDWNAISREKASNIKRKGNPDNLAYVIYTSGSTGKPKGVEIQQRALSNFLLAMQKELNLSSSDRWLALTTVSFDISNLELWLPLMRGAAIILASLQTSKDPFLLAQTLKKEKITVAQATPSTWQMLVDFGWKGRGDLTILCGGEAISKSLADRLAKGARALWNMYGPTETTIWSSMKQLKAGEERITIGRPIANTTFYILNENQQLLPLGVPGELYIGGAGLAKGYRNREELTAERFVAAPFADCLSSRLYRTGDLARCLPNGEIEYLGRLDHQVKIRGYRIELGEIEESLRQCQGVRQAVVVARGEKEGSKRLVAYYTGEAREQELQHSLSLHLPGYMLPSAYVKMEEFPLTHNGKIDRKALPEPNSVDEGVYKGAQTPVEKEIASLFEALLHMKRVSIDSNFFSLGGHSLLAAQAITQINTTFRINLPLKTLFDSPTVLLLSKEVEGALRGESTSLAIPKIAESKSWGLSYSQQRFWFLDQQTRDSSAYTIPFVMEINGNLEIAHLQKAIDAIVHRHEILRTIFKEGVDDPEQYLLPKVSTKMRYEDLRFVDHPEEKSEDLVEKEARKPFDLTKGPLFRFLLIRLADQKYILFLNFHHIVFDGYSLNILMYELKALYESHERSPLGALKIQYRDYIQWQKSELEGSLEKKQLAWWLNALQDAPQILNLPIDKPRPPIQTYKGALFEFPIIDRDSIDSLKRFSQEHESTLFMVLLSMFHVLLYRYTGQSDLVIGIPVSTRTQSDLNDLMGCFINTLPLRITAQGESSFLSLLSVVKDELKMAFDNQDVPFERIIEKLKIERSLSHSPLFQVMFNMLPEVKIEAMGDLQVRVKNIDRGTSHFDLSLSIQESHDGLLGTFEYNTDLFFKETVMRMARHFQRLVTEILKHADQCVGKVPMLLKEEIRRQAVEWNQQPVEYPKNGSILKQIEKRVASYPKSIAVICEGKEYSYSQINAQANRVAHSLLQQGLKPEDKVVIALERSADFIAAILGVLKAGGVYVPVDIKQPKEKSKALLQGLQPLCILTHSHLKGYLPRYVCMYIDQLPSSESTNPALSISPDQLAYIIYTSGSTGKPKGVEIEHKSISDRVFWKNAAYPLSPKDRILHTYSFLFDGAIINYLWPLCVGAKLVIATQDEVIDSAALMKLIRKYRVTTMDLLPSLLQNLLEEKEIISCRSLKTVFSGGEALSRSTLQLFYQKFPKIKLHNTYGPTEATVEASAWECTPDYPAPIAPIGKPIAGAHLYILDQNQNIVPIGVPGELHIGGKGLARGYFQDPELTAEKFVRSPFTKEGGRLYKTGDLAKYSSDGNIEFLGRIDNQVKIRGYRVDLREIELALLQIDHVDKVIVRMRGSGLHQQLVAYVILSSRMDESLFLKRMKRDLAEHLPPYMIPQYIVILENWPSLPNGKINYKGLPEPHFHVGSATACRRECKNELERQFLPIWKEVLGFEDICPTDHFFEIGGNSLLAMRLIARIKHKMSIPVSLVQLFQHPTIESFAQSLDKIAKPWSPLVCMRSQGSQEPFFCVHPVGGSILCYQALAKQWEADRPLYALQAKGLEEGQTPYESIELMAKEYVREILRVQPLGPYFIGGWSFGGLIAAEMARQLHALGEEVARLVLIDTTAHIEKLRNIDMEDESLLLTELTNHLKAPSSHRKSRLSFKERFVRFIENGGKRALRKGQKSDADRLIQLAKANYRALQKFSIPSLDTDVILIKSEANPERARDCGWRKHTGRLKILNGPGDHWAVTQNEYAADYARLLLKALSPVGKKRTLKVALTNQKE